MFHRPRWSSGIARKSRRIASLQQNPVDQLVIPKLSPDDRGLKKVDELTGAELLFEIFSIEGQRVVLVLRCRFLHLHHPEIDLRMNVPHGIVRADHKAVGQRSCST